MALQREKAVVVDKELGLQNAQPVELGKEIGGCVRNRPQWVGRVELLVVAESHMGGLEIEVVQVPNQPPPQGMVTQYWGTAQVGPSPVPSTPVWGIFPERVQVPSQLPPQ